MGADTRLDRVNRRILTGYFGYRFVRIRPQAWSKCYMNDSHLTFEALVHAYSSDLYRYAYWLCRESSLAEDLVQETFMRAWRALDTLENPQSAKAWLFTILRRELSRYLSKQAQTQMALGNSPDRELVDGESERVEQQRVETWILNRAMKTIPATNLEPLLLQVIGGYTCEEIATLLALTPGAVMTRVCRARQQLRSAMLHDTDTKQQAGQ